MDLLTVLIIVLIVLWLGGMVAVPVVGNAVHILLVIVLILVVLKILGNRPVL